jgi:hypothetical protein
MAPAQLVGDRNGIINRQSVRCINDRRRAGHSDQRLICTLPGNSQSARPSVGQNTGGVSTTCRPWSERSQSRDVPAPVGGPRGALEPRSPGAEIVLHVLGSVRRCCAFLPLRVSFHGFRPARRIHCYSCPGPFIRNGGSGGSRCRMCNDAAGNAFGCPKSCRGSPESGLSLSGKVAVVTEASKGVGASVAEVRECLSNERCSMSFLRSVNNAVKCS